LQITIITAAFARIAQDVIRGVDLFGAGFCTSDMASRGCYLNVITRHLCLRQRRRKLVWVGGFHFLAIGAPNLLRAGGLWNA
jgi:hypothetical protein